MSNVESSGWWDQAPIVDVQPNKRVWFRRVARLLVLAVGVARIWWPVWPAVAVWMLGGRLLGGAALAATAMVALLWPWLGARVVAAPRRTAERVFRWRWPATCSGAGLVAPAHGGLRFPELVSVGFGGRWWHPEWMTLVLRVLPVHEDQGTWPRIARRLAIQLRYSLATPVVLDALLLEVRLKSEVLPVMAELGTDVGLEGGLFDDPHRVPIGISSLGGTSDWELDRPTNTSMLIGGGMGGGKSSVTNVVGRWTHRQVELGHPAEMIIIDPKGLGDFLWAEGWASVVHTPEGAWRAIQYLTDEVTRRTRFLNRLGLQSWIQLPPEEMQAFGGRIVFVLDEMVNFFVLWRGGQDKAAQARAKRSWEQLQMLTSMGRAMGINVILATQHPIAEHVGPYGSTMFANMAARVGIGALEPSGAKTLFKESGEAIAARTRHVIPGRMFVMALNAQDGSGTALPAQAFFASPRFLAELPDLPLRRVHRFDDPADDVIDVEEVLV